jgi:hypothetical protein
LRERAIMLLDMLYTFEAERYNSDVISRSNGVVVNAQIIYTSRGLSRLTSASALRTNCVSSLGNRRASILGHVLGDEIVGTRSERRKGDRLFGVSAG